MGIEGIILMYKGKDFKHNRRPRKKYNEERQLQGLKVEVRNDDVGKALRILKKRMQNEGVFNEMRERTSFRKKSEKRRLAQSAGRRRWLKRVEKMKEVRGY